MADFSFQPAAAGIKPQEVTSLSDMMQQAKAGQDYQKGAIELSQAKQKDKERLAVQDLMAKNPEALMTNGMFDAGKLNQIIPRIAPMTGSAYIDNFTKLGTAQNQFMDSSSKLNQSDKTIFSGALGILGRSGVTDPNVYISELDHMAKQHDGNPNMLRLIKAQKEIFKQLPPGQHIAEGAIKASQSLMSPSEQNTAFNPTAGTINTGADIYQTTTTNPVGGAAPSISVSPTPLVDLKLPPGSRMSNTGTVDANNNPIYDVRDASGNVIGQTTVPSNVPASMLPGANSPPAARPAAAPAATVTPTAAPAAPAAAPNAIVRIPAGQTADSGKLYLDESNAARASAIPAKNALTNIDVALKYLPLANVGKYSEAIAGLQSLGGNIAGSKPEELAAAARDIIQKTMVDLSLQKNAALGGKFAADLAGAQNSLADAGKNPTAIMSSLMQLKPLLQHAYNYTQGLDKAIQASPIHQYVKPQFDAAMNAAYDPLAMQWKNAADTGGREGALKFAKDNKINVKDQAKMLKKLEGYKMLVNGDLAGYQQLMLRGD